MGLKRTELDISQYIKPDEMWYGIDRTEGGLGLKIPVRSEMVLQKRVVEAQLILNLAYDLMNYCRRSQRGERAILDSDNLELDMITAENPTNAGVKLVSKDSTLRDPYYIKIFLNKTFGINNLNIAWGMCSDETLLLHYMDDLKRRFGNGGAPEAETRRVQVNVNFSE
jgi:hypothetical protein